MDKYDGNEGVELGETSRDVPSVVKAGLGNAVASLSVAKEEIIRVDWSDNWAELKVDVSWSADGRRFYCHSKQYRAGDNGNKKGNVRMQFYSGSGNWGWFELTNDDGIQDGVWRDIPNGGDIAADQSKAFVWFEYEWDFSVGDDPERAKTIQIDFVAGAPTITTQSGDFPDQPLTLTGGGGAYGAGTIEVYNAANNSSLGPATINLNGSWTATITMPSGSDTLSLYAIQKISSSTSQRSNLITVNLIRTTLTSPAANELLPGNQVVFKGAGFPGTQVVVVRTDNQSIELTEKVLVKADRTWEARSSNALPDGPLSVQAKSQFGNGPIKYTAPLSFNVLGMLVITPPTSDQEMDFTVFGANGRVGARVEVKMDLADTKVGEGTVLAGGVWSAPVRMPPGPTSFVAEQIYQNVRSQRSVAQAFRIKPPKLLDIKVDYPGPATVRFSGAGYEGAEVQIFIDQASEAELTTKVGDDDAWSVDWPDHHPSQRKLNARQSVADGAGGWIHSAWYGVFNITVPVPVPYLTVQVDLDRIPKFSGIGYEWPEQPAARIEVRRVGESTPAVPIVEVKDGKWFSAAAEAWLPGSYLVQAWQLFKAVGSDELRSEPTEPVPFVIKAPLPTVEFTHDGLNPRFFGTCLNNARVTVWFDGDEGNSHNAGGAGINWTFIRPQPFMPGAYVVYVTQTIGGQTSNAISRPFNVAVLRPVITSPIDVDVDHNPLIKGTAGIAGAVMRVFDFVTEKLLGEEPVTGDEWSVQLEDRPFGRQSVYAVQGYGQLNSERSATVYFTVILYQPTIDYPHPGDVITRSSRIHGHARKVLGFETATVQLWLKGADAPLATVPARARDGYWWYDAKFPLGAYVLLAKQFFDGQESAFSPEHDFTVVPARPVIESPALLQHIGSTLTVSGHGYTADWVEVAWSDAPENLLGTTQIQENGTWSLRLPIDEPAGLRNLIVQQVCDEYSSGWSEEHPVLLLSKPPIFTAPLSGEWFTDTPLFEGTGDTGKTIEVSYWFDSRQLVTQGHSVVGGTWTAVPDEALAPRPHWMKARHVEGDGSDWGDSLRFEVVSAVENPGINP